MQVVLRITLQVDVNDIPDEIEEDTVRDAIRDEIDAGALPEDIWLDDDEGTEHRARITDTLVEVVR